MEVNGDKSVIKINPRYDERYEIRLATIDDVDALMSFIDTYWRKGHIMAIDKELFLYEFANGEQVNFFLAIDKASEEIEGIHGFYYASNPNADYEKHPVDVWGSIFKVSDAHRNIPLLGIEISNRIRNFVANPTLLGIGVNPNTTVPLVKKLYGNTSCRMKHYYLLNDEIKCYKIAVVNKRHITKATAVAQSYSTHTEAVEFLSMEGLSSMFDASKYRSIPQKDNWYINRRYFNHPYYRYQVYGLSESTGSVDALIVLREVKVNDSRVLRVVDYVGNQCLFSGLNSFFTLKLKENGYEYVDFYNLGFDDNVMRLSGFCQKDDNDPNIIPNYFEPFLRENVDIWVTYKHENTVFFKADGDQDRPNIYLPVEARPVNKNVLRD